MQSMQRHIGRYMKRTADEQQVSILLKDFDDAEQLLSKIIEASRQWRESWNSILTFQARLFGEYEILYAPILGASEDYQGHMPAETPEHITIRTSRIKNECEDLKRDLKDVLDQVDYMVIKPAQDAKDNMQAFRKTIKKRDDKKLDFERYQNRVDSVLKKQKRSDRENAALAKGEKDLEHAREVYRAADDHMKDVLPPLLQAVYSLQPHILTAQIQIQNSLLGHYYTSLHSYCSEEGFPNPAPPMDEVIRIWDDSLRPVQKEAESIAILATGKTVRLGQQNGQSQTNGYRRPSQNSNIGRMSSVSPVRAITAGPSSSAPQLTDVPSRPKITSAPSSSHLLSPHPMISNSPEQTAVTSPSPPYSGQATPLSLVRTPSSTNVAGGSDYFSRGRQPSQSSLAVTPSAMAAGVIGKKKPPPPPPLCHPEGRETEEVRSPTCNADSKRQGKRVESHMAYADCGEIDINDDEDDGQWNSDNNTSIDGGDSDANTDDNSHDVVSNPNKRNRSEFKNALVTY